MYAYRKAKADCFYDRIIGATGKFIDYEENLGQNLSSLLNALRGGGVSTVLERSQGEPRVIAKKLGVEEHEDPESVSVGGHQSFSDAHVFFSDPERAIHRSQGRSHWVPEMRVVGDFEVEFHIVSALWINLVGHKFDAILDESAYGSRLRRYPKEPHDDRTADYQMHAVSTFPPYFASYRNWREGGLEALHHELTRGRSVIALSLDLANFFHEVDPSFMVEETFQSKSGVRLSDWEHEFTSQMVDALKAWSEAVHGFINVSESGRKPTTGLPIGLAAARVIANVVLYEVDQDIQQGLAPVYYGRYVDDMLLILRDPGHIKTADELFRYIADRTRFLFPQAEDGQAKPENMEFKLSYSEHTKLVLQPKKQRAFFLKGQAGLDLLDTIKAEIGSVSSERRLLPMPDELESSRSAKVLAAAELGEDEAVTLGRAHGLTIRRLGWAVQLRAVETLAKALIRSEWQEQREKFYVFACNHILRADMVMAYMDYLPRLFGLATALEDWDSLLRMKKCLDEALELLQTGSAIEEHADGRPHRVTVLKVNGVRVEKSQDISNVWAGLRRSVRETLSETILSSLSLDRSASPQLPLEIRRIVQGRNEGEPLETLEVKGLALKVREADLGRVSYKDHLKTDATRERQKVEGEEELEEGYRYFDDLKEFLEKSRDQNLSSAGRLSLALLGQDPGSTVPFLFPTRPYDSEEISLFLPEDCVIGTGDGTEELMEWARYTRATTGLSLPIKIQASLDESGTEADSESADSGIDVRGSVRYARVDSASPPPSVRLGISSLYTSAESWSKTASGESDISLDRYRRVESIINQAIKADPKPTHLLLPELSIPERWLGLVSERLVDAGISLIAGLDYHHVAPANRLKRPSEAGELEPKNCTTVEREVDSCAVLVLLDGRLGRRSAIQIRQAKAQPAPQEEFDLMHKFGRKWKQTPATADSGGGLGGTDKKPIYIHKGVAIGVLVCSELQNVRHRLHFQGEVDILAILSWNKDLNTFDALVESSSLDIHAYIALVNNRMYGGGRVRVPAKESHKRDLCQVRGGQNEHLLVVEVDVQKLREFQRRAKRWPEPSDHFKPVPEEYCMSDFRRGAK